MEITSSFNIIIFLLTTLLYYQFFKPTLDYATISNPDSYHSFIKSSYSVLAAYALITIIGQMLINCKGISSMCGGNMADNLGPAFFLTFLPWTLLFGVLLLVLTIFPSFKSAFSDVVGYYYVSGEAHTFLTELLQNNTDGQNKETSDMILKIFGNASLLINQIVPENFEKYWSILTPLVKPEFQNDADKKAKFFSLVVSRDTVGEAMWYIYTGLLVASLVQMKIMTRGCKSNTKTQEANYKKFLESEKKAAAEKEKAATTYTIQ